MSLGPTDTLPWLLVIAKNSSLIRLILKDEGGFSHGET